MLESASEDWDTLGITESKQAKVCYTDLKYYKHEAKLMGSNNEELPVTSVYIYYYGPTVDSKEEIAKKIVYESKNIGLNEEWCGDIKSAVCVSI